MSAARVAVVQLPGVNCEAETARALGRVGLEAEVFRWTRAPRELAAFDAYVLPGGFSYQDRVRAGALASKDPLIEVLGARAARGAPVLGICNGAQVLVESGLVPGGGGVELALARNRMPGRAGYYARWVYVRVEDSRCVFTRALEPGTVLPLPVAHGEGRFVARDPGHIPALVRAGGGSVINTASFVARLGAATPQIAYTASKGAVLAMTRELAIIHARQSIRVNALCPGPLRTDLLMSYLNTEAKKQRRLVHIPVGRFGEAREIAQAALFLASDESSYITGTDFLVDGGITAAYVTPE